MKRLYLLLSILFLIYWGCEETTEEDTTPPTPVTLYEIEYQDTLMIFKWSINMDEDFFKYSLFSSNNESMEDKELLFESSNRTDTTFTQTITGPLTYYQVQVMNLDEEKSLSNSVFKPSMFSKTLVEVMVTLVILLNRLQMVDISLQEPPHLKRMVLGMFG